MRRIDTLDGARGLAALIVCLGHFFIDVAGAPRDGWGFYAASFTGSASVGLFFILSGFVIPANLERVSYRTFIIRRLLRIYPVVIVAALVKFAILLHYSALSLNEEALQLLAGAMSLFGNAFFWNEKGIEPIFWTLAIEVKFYILAVLVFLLARRRKEHFFPCLLGLLLGIGALAHHLPVPIRPWISDLGVLVSTLPMLVLGWCGWLWYSGQISRWSLILGACSVALALSMTPYPIYVSWSRGAPSWMLAAVLFLAILMQPRFFTLLSGRAGHFLGQISFPLYAIHPAMLWVMQDLRTGVVAVDLPVFLALTLAASWLIHQLFEAPAIEFSKRLTSRPALPQAIQPVPVG